MTLIDEDTGKKRKWRIVGEPEANASKGTISVASPIARALIGKETLMVWPYRLHSRTHVIRSAWGAHDRGARYIFGGNTRRRSLARQRSPFHASVVHMFSNMRLLAKALEGATVLFI